MAWHNLTFLSDLSRACRSTNPDLFKLGSADNDPKFMHINVIAQDVHEQRSHFKAGRENLEDLEEIRSLQAESSRVDSFKTWDMHGDCDNLVWV